MYKLMKQQQCSTLFWNKLFVIAGTQINSFDVSDIHPGLACMLNLFSDCEVHILILPSFNILAKVSFPIYKNTFRTRMWGCVLEQILCESLTPFVEKVTVFSDPGIPMRCVSHKSQSDEQAAGSMTFLLVLCLSSQALCVARCPHEHWWNIQKRVKKAGFSFSFEGISMRRAALLFLKKKVFVTYSNISLPRFWLFS